MSNTYALARQRNIRRSLALQHKVPLIKSLLSRPFERLVDFAFRLKESRTLPITERLKKETRKQKLSNSEPAYKNALKVLEHFFVNVPQEPSGAFISFLEEGAKEGNFPLEFRSNLAPAEGCAPQFNLLTFNYKVIAEKRGKAYIVATPPEDHTALETQLYLKVLLETAGYRTQLILNPDDLTPPSQRLSADEIKKKQAALRNYAGKKELLEDVEYDLRKFIGQRTPRYNRDEIGIGVAFQDYGSVLDSELEDSMIHVFKQAGPLQRIIYSIGGNLNDVKGLLPEKKADWKKHFTKFCNGTAIAVYGEGQYLQAGHKALSVLMAKGEHGRPLIELPPGWAVVEDNDHLFLNFAPNPSYGVEIGHRSEKGAYIPQCPVSVAMGFGDISDNFGATHTIGVFNEYVGKRVNHFAAIAQNVLSIGTKLHYVVGGIAPGEDRVEIYQNETF